MVREIIESLEARLCLSAGQLDKSFAQDGVLSLPAGVDLFKTATLADGRILVCGSQADGTPYVERYLANGRVDSTFPQSTLMSRLAQAIGGSYEFGLDADQRLLMTGSSADGSSNVLLRIRSDGTLDPKIGTAGIATFSNSFTPISISGLSDGQIVMDGYIANDNEDGADGDDPVTIVGIAEFNSRGKLEKSFGKNGITEVTSWVDMDDEEVVSSYEPTFHTFISRDDGTFLYFLSVEFDGESNLDGGSGHEFTSTIYVNQYSTDGSTTGDFSTGFDGMTGWLLDAKAASDGTIRMFYVQDKSPDGQPNTDYKLFSGTLGSDGTVTPIELSKDDVDEPPFPASGQADGTLLADPFDVGLTRFIAGQGLDKSFAVPSSVTSNSASFVGGTIINDGQILATFERKDSQNNISEFLAKFQSSDAPTGMLYARPISAGKSTGYRFKITWQDAKSVAVHTLDNHDVVVTFPDGSQHPAKLLATDKQHNSGIITATYTVAAPAGGWKAADDGTYTVSVRANHVWDTTGHSAQAMSLGVFNVRIPIAGSGDTGVGVGAGGSSSTPSTPAAPSDKSESIAQDILG